MSKADIKVYVRQETAGLWALPRPLPSALAARKLLLLILLSSILFTAACSRNPDVQGGWKVVEGDAAGSVMFFTADDRLFMLGDINSVITWPGYCVLEEKSVRADDIQMPIPAIFHGNTRYTTVGEVDWRSGDKFSYRRYFYLPGMKLALIDGGTYDILSLDADRLVMRRSQLRRKGPDGVALKEMGEMTLRRLDCGGGDPCESAQLLETFLADAPQSSPRRDLPSGTIVNSFTLSATGERADAKECPKWIMPPDLGRPAGGVLGGPPATKTGQRSASPPDPAAWKDFVRLPGGCRKIAGDDGKIDSSIGTEPCASHDEGLWMGKNQAAMERYLQCQAEAGGCGEDFPPTPKKGASADEVSGLFVDISQTGLAAGVEFSLFSPTQMTQKGDYWEFPVKIKVEGTRNELQDFIDRIAALPHAATFHDISIEPLADRPPHLTMNAVIKIYLIGIKTPSHSI